MKPQPNANAVQKSLMCEFNALTNRRHRNLQATARRGFLPGRVGHGNAALVLK
jgi:hypothetical protein